MSTASAGVPRDKPHVRWIAHHYVSVILTLAAVDTPIRWFGTSYSFAGQPLSIAVTIAAIAVFWCEFQHQRMMCLTCARQVPDVPQQEVERRDRALRTFHWLGTTLGLSALLVVMGTASMTSVLMDGVSGAAGNVVFWLSIAGASWATAHHRRLRPWCPYCGWDDGDDGDEEHDPIPNPSAEATTS